MKPSLLAEITGVYGPVTIPERIIQKIWLRGDFYRDALKTTSGTPLRYLKAGRWNHAEGPDFIGASLEINGELVHGDVEIHFYAEDWQAHGHSIDPAFDNVVLHVVLFPPRSAATNLATVSGRHPQTLVLLPHLHEDIEDYANREALLALESQERSGWQATLLETPESDRIALLRAKSHERWRQKIHFARQRLDTCGWEAACHQLLLETLGLKRNRGPMSTLACVFPLEEMAMVKPEWLYEKQRDFWHLAGLRPANHPLRRLQQYCKILRAHPHWPDGFFAWASESLKTADADAAEADKHSSQYFRKDRKIPEITQQLASKVFAGAIGSSRLNTFIVDVALPLFAACGIPAETVAKPAQFSASAPIVDAPPPAPAFYAYWYHWPVGDIPASLAEALREHLPLSDSGKRPVLCNGLFQGLLQLGNENG